MTISRFLSEMARNNAWSNARMYRACTQLSDAAFVAKRVSFFPSLQRTLEHILLVDRLYLADLEGTGRAVVKAELPLSRALDLAAEQRRTDLRLIGFCDDLDDGALSRVVQIDRGDGVPYRETTGAILSHLFIHQIHHRGQVYAMLAGTSVDPPQLDEFFLASDEPRRRDDLTDLGFRDTRNKARRAKSFCSKDDTNGL